LYVDGLDKADKLLSGEFDIIYGNQVEEFALDDWEKLTTRATGRAGNAPYSQVIGDCNPSTPTHWLLRRSSIKMLPSHHKDNPRLYDENGQPTEEGKRTLLILSRLTGARLLRLGKGIWASASGAIYGDYDPQVHLIDRFEIPAHWSRICVIDFGYRNALVVQWWAVDEMGRMYRYREIYVTGALVDDVAKEIQRLEQWYQYDSDGNIKRDALGRIQHNPNREEIFARIADHDAEDRATLAKNGIDTLPAFKPVKLGIEAVQLRGHR
jgi:phage terminase large subunit